MNAIDLFRIVAPELNFLLTVPPFDADGGWDFGWFCREHAFCTNVVAKLLNVKCEIVHGDILAVLPGHHRLSTLGTTDDYHLWCRTADYDPLDLSICFHHHCQTPQLDSFIFGLGPNGPFNIRILPDNTPEYADLGQDPIIGYIPRGVLPHTTHDLVSNPQLIVATAEAGFIAQIIALHIFQLVTGQSYPVSRDLSQSEALLHLSSKYKDAHRRLLELLER